MQLVVDPSLRLGTRPNTFSCGITSQMKDSLGNSRIAKDLPLIAKELVESDNKEDQSSKVRS